MNFWDIAHFVVPIAATVIGGPGAGIAVSGAMGAGKGVAKGEGAKGALLRGALGAGTGALSAGATGALSKGAGEAAMNQSLKQVLKAGFDESGNAIVTDAALKAAGGMKAGALQGLSSLTSKAQGKNPGETTGMLKTVSSGAHTLGQIASLFGPDENPRFSSVQNLMNGPGMSPMYQYGTGGGRRRTPTLGTGRYY